MRCEELYDLFTHYSRQADRDILLQLIASHIRTCAACARGIPRLVQAVISFDTLTCEECRAYFPGYYEATHPDHPQDALPDDDIALVALHLWHCRNCHEEYSALVELSVMEELGL